jgi:hypothetical protein
MSTEQTSSYATLRRTRSVLRFVSPLVAGGMMLIGLSLFVGIAPELANPGYATSERMIRGVIGLGYLLGIPLAGVILGYVLRAGADLIDVWIDTEVAAEKTADLVERQLVPGVLRMCQLLEKTNDTLAGVGPAPKQATRPAPESSRSRESAGRSTT